MAEFTLNPHVKAILCGRGMCKGGRLLCAATNCLFHPEDSPDPDFGRDIEVKGYVICPRCDAKTEYLEGTEWNDKKRQTVMKCKVCHRVIPKKKINWTQKVVPKHRRTKHEYYHIECWDAMFLDVDDDVAFWSGFNDDKLVRLIRWASRA